MLMHRLLLLLLIIAGAIPSSLQAADHDLISPYVTDKVVALAFADLTSVDAASWFDALEAVGLVTENDPTKPRVSTALQAFQQALVQMGAQHVYVLFQPSDLQQGFPCWVMTFRENGNSSAARRMLTAASPIPSLPQAYREFDRVLVGGANDTQLDAWLAEVRSLPRAESSAALASLKTLSAGLVVWGDADSRRVIRETFPTLPPPLNAIDGGLIADDLHWATLGLARSNDARFQLEIQTASTEVATQLQNTLTHAYEKAASMIDVWMSSNRRESSPSGALDLTFLVPKANGSRLTLTLDEGSEEAAPLKDLLRAIVEARREPAERQHRINQFKQLALGVLLHEAKHGTLIEVASYDNDGKPLLSWRVHLLPYLGHNDLYQQFHLNEPWDSEHNRSLIDQMPEVFANPNAETRHRVGAGRTTYVAPCAAATLFPPRDTLDGGQPLRIRDIKDGISKTILFVETRPEHAVVWTQPKDWDVDLAAPSRGLIDEAGESFTAAFADGHVRLITHDVPAKNLRALLTRDGNDTVAD